MSEVREYVPWETEKAGGLVKLVDSKATERQRQNRVITKAEYKQLFPDRPLSRMTYIRFANKIPRYVGVDMAKVLLAKYPSLRLVEGKLGNAGDGRGETGEGRKVWQKTLERIEKLKLELLDKGIPIPKVGRSKAEKSKFITTAEGLLRSSE